MMLLFLAPSGTRFGTLSRNPLRRNDAVTSLRSCGGARVVDGFPHLRSTVVA